MTISHGRRAIDCGIPNHQIKPRGDCDPRFTERRSSMTLQIMKNGHDHPGVSLQETSQNEIRRRNISITYAFDFGPFRLLPAQRLLLKDDEAISIGSRAMDILIALVERPSKLVSKAELMARVWPNTFVEPENLSVHISALRRILGGGRFFINIPGRGYCFVAPVTVSGITGPADPDVAHNLPAKITRLTGRESPPNYPHRLRAIA
jgi:DNA-binding winged helix-turn-helix (wHTH) protein